MIEDVNIIEGDTPVRVRNMMDCTVGYSLDDGKRRVFSPGVSITVPADELRMLVARPGGSVLVQNYLHVDNKDLAAEFGIDVDEQIEYSWSQKEIDACLTTGSQDELLDALDFAPEGIKEQIATRAVELEIADSNKRKAIKDELGVDVTKQLEVKHAYDSADNTKTEPAKQRRAAKPAAQKTRRAPAKKAESEE